MTASLAILAGVARYMAGQVAPFLREKTIACLSRRVDGDIDIVGFSVSMPVHDPIRLLFQKGKGVRVRVRADRIRIQKKNRSDIPPLLLLDRLDFWVELSTLWNGPLVVDRVRLARLELTIPAKGERQNLAGKVVSAVTEPTIRNRHEEITPPGGGASVDPTALINNVEIDAMKLEVLPSSPEKEPLLIQVRMMQLESAGPGVPMRYRALLTNSRLPGWIRSQGTIGPFFAKEPGSTSVSGDYDLVGADLGVYETVAGHLSSKGRFDGRLNRVVIDGESDVPDFRLKSAGNIVPLKATFHAIVDGVGGDTFLEAVHATLGDSDLLCRGRVAREKDDAKKTVEIEVSVDRGRIEDFVRLATRGEKSPLQGGALLNFRIKITPGPGTLLSRLRLAGKVYLEDAGFTSPAIQEKIDEISRRSQGKPGASEIQGITATFRGEFSISGGKLAMPWLTFAVPGTDLTLNGWYDLQSEQVDFRGVARTRARIAQMMKNRWKRILLRPLDPFFARDGAGAVIRIAITGTRSNPSFRRDRQKGTFGPGTP